VEEGFGLMDLMQSEAIQGNLVRLRRPLMDEDANCLYRWTRDSEYFRLLLAEPARFLGSDEQKKWITQICQNGSFWMINTLKNDETIGEIHLMDIDQEAGGAWLSVAIGEKQHWGRNYGSEAVELLTGYAFSGLGLHRISLTVFSYNRRAVRTYLKAGYQIEGVERKAIHRDGYHWDLIYMGLLESEWRGKRNHG
jgi:RimJ/RimL family protein N-acetyltransferase